MTTTNLILQPGILTSYSHLRRINTTVNGFPDIGLTDLLLLADGSGTAPTNAVSGRSAGLIQHPVATNNAYAWLSGGGGLSLSGTEILSLPTSDASTPWSIVSCGAIVGSVGGTGSERITGLLGFTQFTSLSIRGAGLYARGGNDWNSGSPDPKFQHRAAAAGGLGTSEDLLPISGMASIGKRRVHVLSYNGSSTLTSTVYDKNAAVVATDSLTTSDAALLTISGTTLVDLNPCAGISSNTYAGGQQEIEAFARYSKVLDAAEIELVVAAGVALGLARGRTWV